jgi:hypothetical protein
MDILLHHYTEICTMQTLHRLRNRILLPLILMNSLIYLILKRLRNRGTYAIVLVEAHRHHSFILLPLRQLLFQTLFSRLLTALLSSFQILKPTLLKSSLPCARMYIIPRTWNVHVIIVSRSKQLSFQDTTGSNQGDIRRYR